MEAQLLLQIDAGPDPAFVTLARHKMVESLPLSCQQGVDWAEIVVSELVSNAVEHAQTVIEVRILQVEPSAVRIEVDDDSRGWPTLGDPGPQAESGRGLLLVDRLSRRWGVDRSACNGKTMWAEVVC